MLSISAGYAVHALHYIAVSKSHDPVMTREIAEKYNIPYDSTLKILRQLSRAGLVIPHRGCQGGFTLTRKAEEISLLNVVEAIDGPVEHGIGMPGESGDEELCSKTEALFQEAAFDLKRKLETFTIADLIKRDSKLTREDNNTINELKI